MHKLTSNQPVIYNSELQQSGILEITPEQIIYQNDGSSIHNVMIQCPIRVSETNQYAAGLNYMIEGEDWNTFFSSLVLTSTNEFDKQEEAVLKYVLNQTEGKWGLTESDWIYSS